MTTRIHVSLPVTDLEASVAFYSALFGTEPSKRKDDYANFRLDGPPIHLALVATGAGQPGTDGIRHNGVEVDSAEALAAWRTRLDEAEVTYRVEDDAVCCYAKADKLWVDDPDGNPWELWVRTGDAEVMSAPSKPCCS
jgi:catechol 2,3-dioxygenase-like lactoylglutathione lyase family enzyme